MSEFLLNLVRRGAGLSPLMKPRSSLISLTSPGLEAAPPLCAHGDQNYMEIESVTEPLDDLIGRWGNSSQPSPTVTPRERARDISVQPEARPTPHLTAPSTSDESSRGRTGSPQVEHSLEKKFHGATEAPPKIPLEEFEQSATKRYRTGLAIPQSTKEASSPKLGQEVEVVDGDAMSIAQSERKSPSPVVQVSAQNPDPTGRTPETSFTRNMTAKEAIIVSEATFMEHREESHGGELVARVRPVVVTQPIVRIKPKAKPTPSLNIPSKPVAGRPEPRPVKIRIGTIEVRATPPSPQAPRQTTMAQGFDDYLVDRTYSSRDLD